MADQDGRLPDGPYGPGWGDDPDHYRSVDWGASADRKPRPKTTRNASIATAVVGALAVVFFLSSWVEGDLQWSHLAIACSQIALSVSLLSQYRKLLREGSDEGS